MIFLLFKGFDFVEPQKTLLKVLDGEEYWFRNYHLILYIPTLINDLDTSIKKYLIPKRLINKTNAAKETSTGEIPEGAQRGILMKHLIENGIQPIKGATTYWCIDKILGMGKPNENVRRNAAVSVKPQPGQDKIYLPITEENIVMQHKMVMESVNYGKEALIIHDVLNAYPQNDDLNTIAMKIAVIDVTNSTHLAQYKSQLSLYELANVILSISDFDKRLMSGDPEIVNMIARNIGAVNMFSFASKYCTYHNVETYKKDDCSIFDSVVKDTLPKYVQGLSKHKIDTWRTGFDYASFNECIGRVLDENGIHMPFRRRWFDQFLWYANRG